MTQEVQPLTWQKRTNLEEHQQFFSKINEIIANLAPTVGEAEQAIAQATQAIASANSAIATANAASASADAASQQAQAAANTVAGYNTRLIAVEDESSGNTSNIIDLQDRMGTAEGNIAALQTADGQNVKISRINEYAVGLTGNQLNISGDKGFIGNVSLNFLRTRGADGYRRINIDRSDDEMGVAPAATVLYPQIAWNDKNNNMMSAIYVSHLPDGTTSISVQTRNSDGTIKYTPIAKGDVI